MRKIPGTTVESPSTNEKRDPSRKSLHDRDQRSAPPKAFAHMTGPLFDT